MIVNISARWRYGFAFAATFAVCAFPGACLAAKTLECDLVIGSLADGRLQFRYDEDHKTLSSTVAGPGMYVDHNYNDRQWTLVLDRENGVVFMSVDRQRMVNPILVLEIDFDAKSVIEHRLGNAGVAPGAPKPWRCVAPG
jgi:hypothetical protein